MVGTFPDACCDLFSANESELIMKLFFFSSFDFSCKPKRWHRGADTSLKHTIAPGSSRCKQAKLDASANNSIKGIGRVDSKHRVPGCNGVIILYIAYLGSIKLQVSFHSF